MPKLPHSLLPSSPSCSSANRYLMEQIVDSRHIHAPCVCAELSVSLPCGAKPPFCLRHAVISGPVTWEQAGAGHDSLCIPLRITVCDGCGTQHHVVIPWQIPFRIRNACCSHDALHIAGTVCLLRPVSSECACFEAQLSLDLCLHFTKHTVVCFRMPQDCRPDLAEPLYPQPPYRSPVRTQFPNCT